MKPTFFIFIAMVAIVACSNPSKISDSRTAAMELNNQAAAMIARFQYDSALVLLNIAIDVDSGYYTPHTNKITVYLAKGQYHKALAESEIVVGMVPEKAEIWPVAGMLNELQGDTVKALNYYERGIALYDKLIADPKLEGQVSVNRLNRAVLLILARKESEGRGELLKLKTDKDKSVNDVAEAFLKLSRQEIMLKKSKEVSF